MLIAELRLIVPVTPNWIVSPELLEATVSRNVPGPTSASEVTVSRAARPESAPGKRRPAATTPRKLIFAFCSDVILPPNKRLHPGELARLSHPSWQGVCFVVDKWSLGATVRKIGFWVCFPFAKRL